VNKKGRKEKAVLREKKGGEGEIEKTHRELSFDI
jgi:hypothetical protein